MIFHYLVMDRTVSFLLTSLCPQIYPEALKRRKMETYCVECRAKAEIKDPKKITSKNGRPTAQRVCPVCGTKVFGIGG